MQLRRSPRLAEKAEKKKAASRKQVLEKVEFLCVKKPPKDIKWLLEETQTSQWFMLKECIYSYETAMPMNCSPEWLKEPEYKQKEIKNNRVLTTTCLCLGYILAIIFIILYYKNI